MTRILITGATGYVAEKTIAALSAKGVPLRLQSRKPAPASLPAEAEWITGDTPLPEWVQGCDQVLHLAAKAHVRARHSESAAEFRAANVDFTRALAMAAESAGVKRFVHVSSIAASLFEKQIAERQITLTEAWQKFPYRVSKYEGEQAVQSVLQKTEQVILRPATVYGVGAPGLFQTLLRLLAQRIPLPIYRLNHKRAFIGIQNLTSAIQKSLEMQTPFSGVYELADDENVTLPELVEALAELNGLKRPLLFLFPADIMRQILQMLKKDELASSLYDAVQADSWLFKQKTGWRPPQTLRQGLVGLTG